MTKPISIYIPWDDIRVLVHSGLTVTQAAEKLGYNRRTVAKALEREDIDISDLSRVPDAVFKKYGLDREGQKLPGTTITGTDLSWDDIKQMLGLGMTLKETAACCGITPEGLSAAYLTEHPAIYDSLETWGTVLRARKTWELFQSIEKRALDGDLRSAVTLSRMRTQRHPKDCLAPPATLKDFS